MTSLVERYQGIDRREFLASAAKSIFAASLLPVVNTLGQGAIPLPGGGKKSMADTISVSLPPLEQPTEQKQQVNTSILPPDRRIGYAIVGLGNLTLGQILPAFGACKNSKLVALVSGNPEKAGKIAAQYGIEAKNIYTYKNFEEIRNNPEIEAVYIVLPNALHEEFTLRAASAAKHVLCEKPMATSSGAARNMIQACKKAGRKLMIAYRIQYEPHNRLAMHWARTGHFGKVRLIEMMNSQNIGDPKQWRLNKALSGGGSLPDIGLYCLNTARFILGEEPHTVLATTYSTPGDIRFKEVEESVLWQMHFPSGARVNASTSYGVHQSRRYRCYGDKGGWFGLDPAFDYEGLQVEGSQAQGKLEVRLKPTMTPKKQFALEMDHFSQCILDNKEPFTPGEEGLQDHLIMEAIYESAASGKAVHLPHTEKVDAFRGTPPAEES